MTVFHLVLGVLGLGLGTVMIIRRHNLPIRKTSASDRIASPTLWIYLGVLLSVNGAVQLLLALA